MATGDLATFPKFRENWIRGGRFDFGNTGSMTFALALLSTLTAAGIAAMDFFDDVSGSEVTGTGYSAGGYSISVGTITVSATYPIFMAGNIVIAQNPGGFTNARWGVLYQKTGTNSTSALISYLDLGSDRGNVAGDLTIAWNGQGIMRFL